MACLVHDRARVLQDFVGIQNCFTHRRPLAKSGNTSLIHEDRTRRTSASLTGCNVASTRPFPGDVSQSTAQAVTIGRLPTY
jgi:hypothetical protein